MGMREQLSSLSLQASPGPVSLAIQKRDASLTSAVAARSAITFLVVVHGTVLAGLFAIRLVRRETYRANCCRQN